MLTRCLKVLRAGMPVLVSLNECVFRALNFSLQYVEILFLGCKGPCVVGWRQGKWPAAWIVEYCGYLGFLPSVASFCPTVNLECCRGQSIEGRPPFIVYMVPYIR